MLSQGFVIDINLIELGCVHCFPPFTFCELKKITTSQMIITFFPVMILEICICICSISRFTYFLALYVLYSIVETLYMSYFTIGLLAYIFALISYLPFIVSLLRMAWRDSETRRLVFYRSVIRIWMIALAVDAWVVLSTLTSVEELCEITDFMPDEDLIRERFMLKGRI